MHVIRNYMMVAHMLVYICLVELFDNQSIPDLERCASRIFFFYLVLMRLDFLGNLILFDQ